MLNKVNYLRLAWLIFFTFFFLLMLQITLRYIPFNSEASFLQIKQAEVTTVKPYLAIFYVHVYAAIFCLFAGFTQFSAQLLRKYKKIHRLIGYLYVVTVIGFAAPSGIYIGYYANGGLFSQISFMLLGLLWIFFTTKALIAIKHKRIALHNQMMRRSFALAFSAITLRLWKVILVYLFQPAPMDVYQIVAWLGWIPNLLLIEYWIRKKYSREKIPVH
jgi:uncharacterized membrane protein